ncbi:MAG: tetratricopeptide repeat protein [Ardenticatenaceae bacterium]
MALTKAGQHLSAATAQWASHPHAYRLIGHSYLAQGDWLRAAEALDRAHQLAPRHWLIAWEAGLAYEQLEQIAGLAASNKSLSVPEPVGGQLSAIHLEVPAQRKQQLWQSAGFNAERFMIRGEEALNQNRPIEALKWYQRADAADSPHLFSALFKQMIESVVAQDASAFSAVERLQKQYALPTVYKVEQRVEIPESAFRWISELPEAGVFAGTPLAYSEDEAASMFWWSGEAVAFFFVPSEGEYLLSASVRHSNPPPVEMTIGIDKQQQQPLQLEQADNTWQQVELSVTLNKGIHAVRVGFWNDETVNGLDRNGGVREVGVQKVP